jgi:hypothetical protein
MPIHYGTTSAALLKFAAVRGLGLADVGSSAPSNCSSIHWLGGVTAADAARCQTPDVHTASPGSMLAETLA